MTSTETSTFYAREDWEAAARALGLSLGVGARSGLPVCHDAQGRIWGKWQTSDGSRSPIPNSGWAVGYITTREA